MFDKSFPYQWGRWSVLQITMTLSHVILLLLLCQSYDFQSYDPRHFFKRSHLPFLRQTNLIVRVSVRKLCCKWWRRGVPKGRFTKPKMSVLYFYLDAETIPFWFFLSSDVSFSMSWQWMIFSETSPASWGRYRRLTWTLLEPWPSPLAS